jgi:hypothetical protein
VEIYIDEVVVKSKGYREHLANLCKALVCTRKHGLKMNPNKCAFGVSAGQFLGFMVHERGIEISQKTITIINKVVAPVTNVEFQSLIHKINLSGGLFLICSVKYSCSVHYLTLPPVLVPPQKHKPFKLYLSAD